ncbi:nuclear transport factor 2 family protein [Rhodococcus sp. P1Y]|uniref:nuclear transport factor 2 family protein n=1 Tax=Rhodococcus sp. P1Y TaxID=1302308 RepID=UPI000EB3829A|nr:nuclear transport factor 2 family protein [Rhodococcus sp. P1Y]AYJ51270.1 nuclear transport factor 2 family protein [Rhodococcus sp. P1Y]
MSVSEIISATHTYALGLDKFDPKLALSAFAVDAVWDATPVGLAKYEGHEAILDFFERDAEQVKDQFHIITNHIVHFDSETTAHGTNYVFSEGHTNGGAAFKAIALNEDTYVHTDDGWKIASRVISPLTPPQMEGFEA